MKHIKTPLQMPKLMVCDNANERAIFVYALSRHGVNLFDFLLQPGYNDASKRTSEDELECYAAQIANAVNAHDALVEALERIASKERYMFMDTDPLEAVRLLQSWVNDIRNEARAALALAKEPQE